MGVNVLADANWVSAIPAKPKHIKKIVTTKFLKFIFPAEPGGVVPCPERTSGERCKTTDRKVRFGTGHLGLTRYWSRLGPGTAERLGEDESLRREMKSWLYRRKAHQCSSRRVAELTCHVTFYCGCRDSARLSGFCGRMHGLAEAKNEVPGGCPLGNA